MKWCAQCNTLHGPKHTRPEKLPKDAVYIPPEESSAAWAPPFTPGMVDQAELTRLRALVNASEKEAERWRERVKVLEARIDRAVKILRGE